jgi:hypothetical protein
MPGGCEDHAAHYIWHLVRPSSALPFFFPAMHLIFEPRAKTTGVHKPSALVPCIPPSRSTSRPYFRVPSLPSTSQCFEGHTRHCSTPRWPARRGKSAGCLWPKTLSFALQSPPLQACRRLRSLDLPSLRRHRHIPACLPPMDLRPRSPPLPLALEIFRRPLQCQAASSAVATTFGFSAARHSRIGRGSRTMCKRRVQNSRPGLSIAQP